MCIYSFLSTIDLCLSVNTQPREDKDNVSYLTGQIASEIVMPINMHNQSFSVLHIISKCVCNGIIILCALFIHVSWYLAMLKKHKPKRVWSKVISYHVVYIHRNWLGITYSKPKSLSEVSTIWGVQFQESHRVWF